VTALLRFDGRVAVVTGGGGGLGSSHARLLAERGATVVVHDLPDPAGGMSAASQVVAGICAAGGVAELHESDLTAVGNPERLINVTVERFGRVDIVINNAGLLRSVPFEDMTASVFDEVVAVNLRAAFLLTQAAWPHMMKQGYGRVLCTTSNSGLLGIPGSSAYAMAKAGLWGLVRTLSIEGAEHGINVNAIAPMAFTDMARTSKAAPESWRTGEGDAWSRRLAPPLVSPAAAWLVHEDCTVTGDVWSVAGGRVAKFFMGLTDGYVDDALTVEAVRDRSDEMFHDGEYDVLPRAADEGRRLHRRLLGATPRTLTAPTSVPEESQ
jgi:NAD(P)-dependent dehydrogenase (short-subunit alcohol dehydrogenase family)